MSALDFKFMYTTKTLTTNIVSCFFLISIHTNGHKQTVLTVLKSAQNMQMNYVNERNLQIQSKVKTLLSAFADNPTGSTHGS